MGRSEGGSLSGAAKDSKDRTQLKAHRTQLGGVVWVWVVVEVMGVGGGLGEFGDGSEVREGEGTGDRVRWWGGREWVE